MRERTGYYDLDGSETDDETARALGMRAGRRTRIPRGHRLTFGPRCAILIATRFR
jgi:hypothetical protein